MFDIIIHNGNVIDGSGKKGFDDFMQYMVGPGGLYKKVLAQEDWKWNNLANFYEELEERGVSVNLAPLVGHCILRAAVIGYQSGPPSSDELQRMKQLLETAHRDCHGIVRRSPALDCRRTYNRPGCNRSSPDRGIV